MEDQSNKKFKAKNFTVRLIQILGSVLLTYFAVFVAFISIAGFSGKIKIPEFVGTFAYNVWASLFISPWLTVAPIIIFLFINWAFEYRTKNTGFRLYRFAGLFSIAFIWLYIAGSYTVGRIELVTTGYEIKGKFRLAQFSEDKKSANDETCQQIRNLLPTEWTNLPEALVEIDSKAKNVGAELAISQPYISRAYITYYFKPQKNIELSEAQKIANNSFTTAGIGPTFYWLNTAWAEKNRSHFDYKLFEIENDNLRLRFETLFPTADEFLTTGILQKPPVQILAASKSADLRFVKAERLDPIVYTYAIPITRGYANIHFHLWGIKSKTNVNSFERVLLDQVSCMSPTLIPSFYNDPGGGQGPLPNYELPKAPIQVPSCLEYMAWHRCQEKPDSAECKRIKTLEPPKCKPLNISFPPTEY